jgi:two-component system, cell cycle response regulator
VTVSIGVAVYPVDAEHHDDLLLQADASLYTAKAAGRDCVVWAGIPTKSALAELEKPK